MYRPSTEQRKRAQIQSIATELYERRYNQLLVIAQKNAPTQADAEEALQDSFVAFIRHFDPDGPAPAIAWLILTLKRACWTRWRKGLPQVPADDFRVWDSRADRSHIDDVAATSDMAEQIETILLGCEAMTRLKQDHRTALVLLAMGYSYKEIGELNGWTYTKVNRCVSEGRTAQAAPNHKPATPATWQSEPG
jgi:RNA polymerase sigma factor (sigma-70 family)